MRAPARTSVKIHLVEKQGPLDAAALIPVFHRWIRDSVVEGALIDVADYRHVRNGPGVVLVGRECDYRFDFESGRPGLSYVDKSRSSDGRESDWDERLRVLLQRALVGCRRLEEERSLGVRFRTDDARLTFADRRLAPNRTETRDALAGPVARFFDRLYRPIAAELEWEDRDPRHVFSFHVRAAEAPSLEELIRRLAIGEGHPVREEAAG